MPKTKDPHHQQARTEVAKADMLAALTTSLGIVTSAARAVGIDRRTHTNWVQADPDYAAAVADIQEQALDRVEAALFKKVEDLDTASIIFYLKTKGKARGYVERVQTQEVKAEPFVLERDVTTNTDLA
jgi:hypothetical protein